MWLWCGLKNLGLVRLKTYISVSFRWAKCRKWTTPQGIVGKHSLNTSMCPWQSATPSEVAEPIIAVYVCSIFEENNLKKNKTRVLEFDGVSWLVYIRGAVLYVLDVSLPQHTWLKWKQKAYRCIFKGLKDFLHSFNNYVRYLTTALNPWGQVRSRSWYKLCCHIVLTLYQILLAVTRSICVHCWAIDIIHTCTCT